jgi:hypothetical protein
MLRVVSQEPDCPIDRLQAIVRQNRSNSRTTASGRPPESRCDAMVRARSEAHVLIDCLAARDARGFEVKDARSAPPEAARRVTAVLGFDFPSRKIKRLAIIEGLF